MKGILALSACAVVPVLALALGGCSSDEGAPVATGGAAGAASGGATAGGATAGGAGGASGGASAGGLTGAGGKGAGGASDCPTFREAAPPTGVTQVHRVPSSIDTVGVVAVANGNIYFADRDGKLSYIPSTGGTPTDVGTFPGAPALVGGNRLVWWETVTGDAGAETSRLVTAPLSSPTTTTVVISGIGDLESSNLDATHLYYSTTSPPNLYRVALTADASPELLATGMNPLGSVVHGGFFYWMDFDSSQLERVPLGGGARERLTEVHFGGPMAGEGDAVFWADTSLNRIEKWTPAGGRDGLSAADPTSIAVGGGIVYWGDGAFGSTLRSVHADGTSPKQHLCGLDNVRSLFMDGTAVVFSSGRFGILRYQP